MIHTCADHPPRPASWQMAELQRQLGLDVAILEEYQETQQSLYPVLLVGGRKMGRSYSL